MRYGWWLLLSFLYVGLMFLLVIKRGMFINLHNFNKELKLLSENERQDLKSRFGGAGSEKIEGFLWGVDGRYVYIVNLTGIKRYSLSDLTGLFYLDMCEYRAEDLQDGATLEVLGPFTVGDYRKKIRSGDYVEMKLYKERERFYVDKLWGYSGNFYLNGLVVKEKLCKR